MRTADNLFTPIEPITAPASPVSEAAAEAWIPRTCFKNGPPGRVGVELELLVVDARHGMGQSGSRHIRHRRRPVLLRELSDGGLDSTLTVEPGGQVELSSRPGPHLSHTVDLVRSDLAAINRRAARLGFRLVGEGVDPISEPVRVLDDPRYVAMESYFDRWGPAGRIMMCSTASVQVNVEAGVFAPGRPGSSATIAQRWDVLHAIGPALVAAFGNSPRHAERLTGWKSTRQAVWATLDPTRTSAPRPRPGEDLADAWARCSMDAPVMIIRRDRGPWTAPAGLTFREWIRQGRAAVPDRPPPTIDDLAYHLTTLFPPVRPRGHLEVRYIDAQPGPWWTVPPAVITALLDDDAAGQRASEICRPTRDRWRDAARLGMQDPLLARAASGLLELAAGVLSRDARGRRFAGQVEGYLERWTARGRSPADDAMDDSRDGLTHGLGAAVGEQIGDLP
jgi:glutamate--cysteine ligase